MSRNLLSFPWFNTGMEKKYPHDLNYLSIFLKLFVLTLMLTKLPLSSSAQGTVNWKLDTTINGVEFFHAIVNCDSKKFVFLKFNNKNTQPVKLSWKEEFVVRTTSDQKRGPFKQKALTIAPGQTFISDCNGENSKGLLTYPDQQTPVYDADIVTFSFREIKVAK